MTAQALEICVEVCERDEPTFFRCVVLPGDELGLQIQSEAQILWKEHRC